MRFRQHERTARQSTLHLLALFALVVVGLLLAVNLVLAAIYWLTFPFARGFPTLFFETNSALVLLFVLGGCWVETVRLSEGGAHVARLAGGREAQVSAGGDLGLLERRFANTVQEMAIASGHPGLPAGWVLPKDDAINAFAAGWGEKDAVIAVTRGALERLTRAELQGVVAHEFSHLVHGDTRLNMRLIGLVWGLQMIWGLGLSLWEPDERGRRGAGTLFGLGLMAVGSLGWAAGRLLQAAVSRQREFLADASAVKYTRVVDGLGGALRKIADQQLQNRAALQSAHAASLAHLLLSNRGASGGWRALWHTHPPLAERLRRLYGREVLTLAAPVLDVSGDEAEPLMRLAPAGPSSPAGAAWSVGPSAGPDARDGEPEAFRHDALQNPSAFDERAREVEALARIDRWHGPGEWQAAMLALAIDSAAGWAEWRAATADLRVAASVRAEIEALGVGARRRVFELLLDRARAAPPAARRRQRREWLARSRAEVSAPAQPLRAWVICRTLGPQRRFEARATLATRGNAVRAATRAMARCLGTDADTEGAWQAAALAALQGSGLPALRGPAAGLAPATPLERDDSPLQALRVRQLSPMQAPLLLRAWVEAARFCGVLEQRSVGDALHLACVALRVPVPDALR